MAEFDLRVDNVVSTSLNVGEMIAAKIVRTTKNTDS